MMSKDTKTNSFIGLSISIIYGAISSVILMDNSSIRDPSISGIQLFTDLVIILILLLWVVFPVIWILRRSGPRFAIESIAGLVALGGLYLYWTEFYQGPAGAQSGLVYLVVPALQWTVLLSLHGLLVGYNRLIKKDS